MKPKLLNNGRCILIRTKAGSDEAECAICRRRYDSIFVTAHACKYAVREDGYEEALKSRLPNIVKLAIGYSRWYLTQVLTGKATPASQALINIRLDICETNSCGLYKSGRCFDCGCFVNRLQAHEARNRAAWNEKMCERGYWDKIEVDENATDNKVQEV